MYTDGLFKHSFLVFYRDFKRFKGTFIINLIGLSTGLSCVVLIYLWVSDEMKFDKFHLNDERLFQVLESSQYSGGVVVGENTAGLLAQELAQQFPEIEYASPGIMQYPLLMTKDGDHIKVDGGFVGKDFFNMFSYKLIQGRKNKVLTEKNSAVISEKLARQVFGTTEGIIGQSISIKIEAEEKSFYVTGVFLEPQVNSTFRFDMILSFEEFKDDYPEVLDWNNARPHTFLVLKEGTNSEQFGKKIAGFMKSKVNRDGRNLIIRKYSDGYLYGKYENGKQAGGRIEYVRMFSTIAGFILIIACINFINISTAKASRRTTEVGVKKALGVQRKNLVYQYLGESFLSTYLALIISLLLVQLLLPKFNMITGKDLTLNFSLSFAVWVLIVTFITGLVAGGYPALYISGFNPVMILKGRFKSSIGELWVRKGLVIFQFTLTVILITGVIIVSKQIEFIQKKNLGYDKENILYFEREAKIENNLETFLSEVKNIPGVASASYVGANIVGNGTQSGTLGDWPGKEPGKEFSFKIVPVHYDMLELLGIKIKEGRSFSRNFNDTYKLIFNEAAIATMGLKNPVGQRISGMEIVGVAENFNFESLHEKVKPLFFILASEDAYNVAIRIQAGQDRETIERLQDFYQDFNPGYPLEYKFLDDDFQAKYISEQRISSLSRYFAGLAILISCLGLFGLAAFTAERRLKEIAIRKVCGSSNANLLYILSSDFMKVVMASIIIGSIISFLSAKYWLNNFAYRIELSVEYFLYAGLVTLAIAWLTVGVQIVRAVKINLTKVLRTND